MNKRQSKKALRKTDGPLNRPSSHCRYRARDGKYYNGYLRSSDAANDYFAEAMKRMVEDIKNDLDSED